MVIVGLDYDTAGNLSLRSEVKCPRVRRLEAWIHRDRDQKDLRYGKVHREIAKSTPIEKSGLPAYRSTGGIRKLLRTEAGQILHVGLSHDRVERNCGMARCDYAIQMIDSKQRQARRGTGNARGRDFGVGECR